MIGVLRGASNYMVWSRQGSSSVHHDKCHLYFNLHLQLVCFCRSCLELIQLCTFGSFGTACFREAHCCITIFIKSVELKNCLLTFCANAVNVLF